MLILINNVRMKFHETQVFFNILSRIKYRYIIFNVWFKMNTELKNARLILPLQMSKKESHVQVSTFTLWTNISKRCYEEISDRTNVLHYILYVLLNKCLVPLDKLLMKSFYFLDYINSKTCTLLLDIFGFINMQPHLH